MAEPYVKVFDMIGIGSVVLDQEDFNEITAKVKESFNLPDNTVKTLLDRKYIPLISRGTKTEWLFDRFGVGCDKMTIVVRGFANRMLNEDGIGQYIADVNSVKVV